MPWARSTGRLQVSTDWHWEPAGPPCFPACSMLCSCPWPVLKHEPPLAKKLWLFSVEFAPTNHTPTPSPQTRRPALSNQRSPCWGTFSCRWLLACWVRKQSKQKRDQCSTHYSAPLHCRQFVCLLLTKTFEMPTLGTCQHREELVLFPSEVSGKREAAAYSLEKASLCHILLSCRMGSGCVCPADTSSSGWHELVLALVSLLMPTIRIFDGSLTKTFIF